MEINGEWVSIFGLDMCAADASAVRSDDYRVEDLTTNSSSPVYLNQYASITRWINL